MVWHAGLGRMLLLGGAFGDSATWSWDGERWRVVAEGGPAIRLHFGLAYDAARDRVVAQGGFERGRDGPIRFGDTWEWDRRRWRRIEVAGGPGTRDHLAMVYDPVRKETLLFGGSDSTGTPLGDTWTWNGRSWRRAEGAGPPPRSTHRMVFDLARGVVVMFGGFGVDGPLGDTWEWNGSSWRQVGDSGGPAPRFGARVGYDSRRQRTVLFGGRGASRDFGDTWEWDGRSWRQVDAAGPSMRNGHAIGYDPRAGGMLVFGGFRGAVRHQDLWRFDGRRWLQIPRPDARPPGGVFGAPGPHPVGYRVIDHWDSTRADGPARDYLGRPTGNRGAVPMQVSVWYPAARSAGPPMTIRQYLAIAARRETLGQPTDADLGAGRTWIATTAGFGLGITVTDRTADSLASVPTGAIWNAAPAPGRYPLLLGGLGGPSGARGIAEHLASFGYVVVTVPNLPRTGTLQVTAPQIAVETQTRDIETVSAIARALPFVDPARLGLVGMNFDGLAAVVHQMRNMSAAAVVTIDGIESPAREAILRGSPYFDPGRFRVPYLGFRQDNPPAPALALSDSLLSRLRYADRSLYVLRDLEHAHLLNDLTVYPQLTAERRLGYDFLWRAIRMFLDAHLRGDSAAGAFLGRSPAENGYPGWVVRTEWKAAALPAIPTADEVEEIAMRGDVAGLSSLLRRARTGDPEVRLFTEQAVNLYAFRFSQRGEHETALGFRRLAVEAFPRSTGAANNLGNALRDAGQVAEALRMFEAALGLIAEDPEIGPAEKGPSRVTLERKIAELRNR